MKVAEVFADVALLFGGFLIVAGVWFIYEPAALIVLGVALVGVGLAWFLGDAKEAA